jgi:hypothetical protein
MSRFSFCNYGAPAVTVDRGTLPPVRTTATMVARLRGAPDTARRS